MLIKKQHILWQIWSVKRFSTDKLKKKLEYRLRLVFSKIIKNSKMDNNRKIADCSPIAFYSFSFCSILKGLLLLNVFSSEISISYATDYFLVLGLTQSICGIIQIFDNKVFPGTLFIGFGVHWIFQFVISSTKGVHYEIADSTLWMFFTFVMFVNSFETNWIM
ncbi:hypothetical protein MHBO_000317, partial [Bonamia ostreae]